MREKEFFFPTKSKSLRERLMKIDESSIRNLKNVMLSWSGKNRTSFSRRLTANELRLKNGKCRVYSTKEREDYQKKLMIQVNLRKLLEMQTQPASNNEDYFPILKSKFA